MNQEGPSEIVASKSCNQITAETRRFRTTFEQNQLDILESMFESTQYPDAYMREEIAAKTGLSEAKVQVTKIK